MRSNQEQYDNIVDLDKKRQEKLGSSSVGMSQERRERQWPTMSRNTARFLIWAVAVPATAFSIFSAYRNEQQNRTDAWNKAVSESTAERTGMTKQEAAEHGRQEAVEQTRQEQAYEQAERPDEMNAGVRAEHNGSEAAIEIGSPTSTVNPEETSND